MWGKSYIGRGVAGWVVVCCGGICAGEDDTASVDWKPPEKPEMDEDIQIEE